MKNGGSINSRRNKRKILKFSIITIIIAIAIGSVVGFTFFSEKQKIKDVVNVDTIYNNIFINDVSVGGLKKDEALKKVNENYTNSYSQKKIIVNHGDESVEIKFSDLKPTFDFTAPVDEAHQYAREGSLKDRYNQIITLETTPKKITYNPALSYDKAVIHNKLVEFTDKFNILPVSATMTRENGQFTVVPERTGYKSNLEVTERAISKLIAENTGGTVDVIVEEVKPQIVASDFENAKSLIGSFTTSFIGSIEEPRNINLKTASSKINGYVLYPGETFSTNNIFGAMTYDNGYRNATVIQGGEFVDGMGGGVCQVSSTLYNAILYAELPIIERQNHSLKVGYTDWGFDATLAGDYIDLKFMNNTEYPVLVESYLTDNKATVNIYGQEIHGPGRKLVFSNALITSHAPGAEEVIEDPNLPDGQRVVEKNGKNGYTYDVYKTVYENDKEVKTVHINSSYYRPSKAKVRVGSGKSVAEQPAETKAPTLEAPKKQVEIQAPVINTPKPAPVEALPQPDIPEAPPTIENQTETTEELPINWESIIPNL